MIYLDNNSTTRADPVVVAAMQPYWSDEYYNPASAAGQARGTREPLEAAVKQLAGLLNASPDEFTLTSGATESNNWIIQSVVSERVRVAGACHVLISSIEHPSVMETAEELGFRDARIEIERIPVTRCGVIDLNALQMMIRPDTALVCVMFANNETGVLQPVVEASQIAKNIAPQCLFHCDATQAIGKVVVDLQELECVDFLSLSAHKFHGPKGVGALFVRQGKALAKWMHGGSQQGARRAGTENPALAAGLAKAIELLGSTRGINECERSMITLRNVLETGIKSIFPEIQILGFEAQRLANTSLLVHPEIEGEMIVHGLLAHGIVTATGSACSNGGDRPSYVVTSMGVSYGRARNALRLSLSRETNRSEIENCVMALRDIFCRR